MNYKESLKYIHSTPKFARVLGNDMLKKLLFHMGDPQKRLKFIHIAGTNGKGSAAKMLSEILIKAGYNTGLFTSPFIEQFNERIRVNSGQIPDDSLAEHTTYVREIIEKYDAPVSEFALDEAIAFSYFKECGCDFVVLETGLGGRIDATNVIDSAVVTMIMSIGYDHMQYLGNTLTEIAGEKCGIIKKNADVVAYPRQEDEVWKVIHSVCAEQKAALIVPDIPEKADGGFLYKGKLYHLNLKGIYQMYNASAVLEAVEVLRGKGVEISQEAVADALAEVEWEARFEFFGDGLVIDGGHNIDGVKALVSSLKALDRDVVLLVGMMADKSCRECAEILSEAAAAVVTTQVDIPRAISAEDLAGYFKGYMVDVYQEPNIDKALKKAQDIASDGGLVCVCGSLFLAGEVRKRIKGKYLG